MMSTNTGAYYKDKVKITRDDLEEQLDLLDVIRGDSND